MERLEDEPLTGEVFANEIEYYLQEFCEQRKPPIEDMTTAPQGVWNAALLYIQHHLFKGTNKLKSKSRINNINNNIPTNNNAYNYELVNDICDIYIYICNIYNKEVSIMGFSKLTGINQDTFHDWHNKINKLSNAGCEIYEKLTAEREESLSAKLVDSKQAVAQIAILNKHYGWNLPGVSKEREAKKALTAADIRARLSDSKHTEIQDIVNGG